MKRQAYQHPELRDANDNIIQEGTYGKESPLVNSDNTGVLDYINNNLEALHDNITGSRMYVANKDALPATGDLSAMYITEDTGKWYVWNGTTYIESDDARKSADEAIAARDAATASQAAAKAWATAAASSASAAASSATAALESSAGATTAMNETKKQAQQAAASIAEASAMVDKVEKNSTIVSEQLKQAQALATASAGIQIYEDTDGDLAYRLVLPTTTEEG